MWAANAKIIIDMMCGFKNLCQPNCPLVWLWPLRALWKLRGASFGAPVSPSASNKFCRIILSSSLQIICIHEEKDKMDSGPRSETGSPAQLGEFSQCLKANIILKTNVASFSFSLFYFLFIAPSFMRFVRICEKIWVFLSKSGNQIFSNICTTCTVCQYC